LHALDHNLGRIADDHLATRALAEAINSVRPGTVDQESVVTNIVLVDAPDAPSVAARLRERGVLVSVLGPSALRAVTHLDVTAAQCAEAGALIAAELAG
ncbi:low specificity L-threonine aldolase, partial [Tessaracoccus lubricantis]